MQPKSEGLDVDALRIQAAALQREIHKFRPELASLLEEVLRLGVLLGQIDGRLTAFAGQAAAVFGPDAVAAVAGD